jgi:hypothetical protein
MRSALTTLLILAAASVPAQTPPAATAFSSCTEPLSTVAVPNAPHGLYVLLFPGRRNASIVESLQHNPLVCGANVYVVWAKVDRGPGASPRYDWSSVDEQMAPWIAAGKRVNLVVWATGYSPNRSMQTPAYVMAKVETISCERSQNVPIFWSPEFVDNYQPFMAAVAKRYSDNPSVGYIRFGLSGGGETFPLCFFELMKKYPNFNAIWRDYLIKMLDYEKSFHSSKLMVGLTPFGGALGKIQNHEYLDAVARAAVRNGIAIGSQGLQASDKSGDAATPTCWYCRLFQEHRGKVASEIQTIKQSDPEGGPPGSMVDLMPFALRQGAQIFEIYLQDWQIAYDPDDPQYARHHAEYQRAFEAVAKVVGGSPK